MIYISPPDVLGSSVGWAASIQERRDIKTALDAWKLKSSTFSIGVCNGCQLLAQLGWIGEVFTNELIDELLIDFFD